MLFDIAELHSVEEKTTVNVEEIDEIMSNEELTTSGNKQVMDKVTSSDSRSKDDAADFFSGLTALYSTDEQGSSHNQ